MNQSASLPSSFVDRYPSRANEPARIMPRQDPVIYSADMSNSPITPALLKQYRERGFLLQDNIFNESEIECFQQELERLRNSPEVENSEAVIREPGNHAVRSIFQVHRSSRVFKKLAEDSRLAGLASFLLNDQVYIHQSRLNYKPGFRGREFYWHSDFETWHVEDGMPNMRALSMSITLTENAHNNGPLMMIPGSHRHYVICEGYTPPEHFKSSLKAQEYGVPSDASLSHLVSEGGIETATGKPGSVIIFDCNLMHGSNSNITPFPRSNIFFVYNALSNRVVRPFCSQPPRPEFICSRTTITPISQNP